MRGPTWKKITTEATNARCVGTEVILGDLKTSVYRIGTSVGVVLHCNNNHPTCRKPTESPRTALVHVKDPIPMQNRQNVVNSTPNPYVGQTGSTFATRMKKH